MAIPWRVSLSVGKMVWVVLYRWVSSCLLVANEIARSIRTGDIGPFPVG